MTNRARWIGPAGLLAIASLGIGTCGVSAAVLKQEPGPGKLRVGQTVLVDDGSCPPGQIKQVTGGRNMDPATRASIAGPARQRTCVPRK